MAVVLTLGLFIARQSVLVRDNCLALHLIIMILALTSIVFP